MRECTHGMCARAHWGSQAQCVHKWRASVQPLQTHARARKRVGSLRHGGHQQGSRWGHQGGTLQARHAVGPPASTLWISHRVGGGAPRSPPGSGCCEPLSESCRGPQAADVGRLAAFSHCPPPGVCNTGLAPHPTPFVVANAPIHPASA